MTATIQLFSPINSIPFLVGARAGAAALTNTATTTTASWSTSNGLTVSLTGNLGDITVAAGDPAGSGNKLVVMLGSAVLADVSDITFNVNDLEVAWSAATWNLVLSQNDTVSGSIANETFNGGAGEDLIDYSGSSSAVTVDLANGWAKGQGKDTLIDIENATGSIKADKISGSSGANTWPAPGSVDTRLS